MTNTLESPLLALLEASANSPLVEADPKSLDELMRRAEVAFNIKPLDLTDEHLVDCVLYYRAKRANFALLAKEKADKDNSESPRGKRKPAASIAEALQRQADKIEL